MLYAAGGQFWGAVPIPGGCRRRPQQAQWLRLEQHECEGKLRSYTPLDAETLIIVNYMVRLAGLRFSPGSGGLSLIHI